MKNFKDLIREIKVSDKKELKNKQRRLSFQFKTDNADRELLEKKNKIKKINEVLKFRDPILETMSYAAWAKIEQNQAIIELDLEQAKMLYEADMFRAQKVQTSAKARAGRSGRSGSGAGGFGRKRKATAKETGPPHAGEIVEDSTSSGSPHPITLTKTISNPTVSAAVYLQLPAASAATAYYDYIVKDGKGIGGTHSITITTAGGTIDGSTSYVISSNYGTIHFITDGTEWFIY